MKEKKWWRAESYEELEEKGSKNFELRSPKQIKIQNMKKKEWKKEYDIHLKVKKKKKKKKKRKIPKLL